MNPAPLVSIIIPVYNTSRYLRKCLDSVVQQTYSNLEIIIVNDGSTDDSPAIIKEYANRDKRIIYIDKPNEGLPLTRKAGVERATGKYIQHLDSDDALAHGAIRMMVDRAEETGADIVAIPFYYVYEDETRNEAAMLQFDELSPIEYFKRIVHWKGYWAVWANFQKRSLFESNRIEFVPHIHFGEDAMLMLQLLFCAHKVAACDVPVLYYRQRRDSMTNNSCIKNCQDYREYTKWMEKYIIKKGYEFELREEIALLHMYVSVYCICANDKMSLKQDIAVLLTESERFPDAFVAFPEIWKKLVQKNRKHSLLGRMWLAYYRWKGEIRC